MQDYAMAIDGQQEVLMQQALIDGHSVSAHRFRSVQDPAAVIAQLKARWHARGLDVIETSLGVWSMISMREGRTITTVQVKAGPSGSEGLSARWQHDASTVSRDIDAGTQVLRTFMPREGTLLRQMSHQDQGQLALTWVALSAQTPLSVVVWLRARAQMAGFDIAASSSAEVLILRRRHEEVVVTITHHPRGSALVMYWSAS